MKTNDVSCVLERERATFIEHIRDHVRAQKDLWRRVPWCALHADDGYHGAQENDLAFAYYSGLWRIRETSWNIARTAAVDLFSGELVYADGPPERLSDDAVYRIGMRLELIDAERVLRRLHHAAKHQLDDIPPVGHVSVDAWRQVIIERTKLTPIYERPRFS